MYVASDLSTPSTIDAVSLGLEHRGATQHRSKLSDNFFVLPEIFREIFAHRARSVVVPAVVHPPKLQDCSIHAAPWIAEDPDKGAEESRTRPQYQ